MKSPADKNNIQVEITNACPHNCAHCTRHCGHQPKPFFMDLETFERAVESLEGYSNVGENMVGIMGGEPTLHPDFHRLIERYAEKVGGGRRFESFRKPTSDFLANCVGKMASRASGRGLWTSLGSGYYKHFELIQDVFDFQVINDHQNPGVHQAIMIARKDLGIADAEWFKLRDKCWLQNSWSASITPKGAFFCEVAAAFDLLFDGPGGWPIEKGWWKRKPEDFKEQLDWCELCSVALDVPLRRANTHVDIISKSVLERLEKCGSPKIKRGQFEIFTKSMLSSETTSGKVSKEGTWYLQGANRIKGTNSSLLPKSVSLVLRENCAAPAAGSPLAKEKPLAAGAFEKKGFADWALLAKDLSGLEKLGLAPFKENIFNPGCLYYLVPGFDPAKERELSPEEIFSRASLIFLNSQALSLRDQGALPLGPALAALFPPGKRIHMDLFPRFDKPGVVKASWLSLKSNVLSPLKRKLRARLAKPAPEEGSR